MPFKKNIPIMVRPWRKQIYFLTFLVFLLVLIIFFELFLRLVGYGIDSHPFLRDSKRPSYYVINPDFHLKYYPTPVYGDRDLSQSQIFPVFKNPETKRVFVLGESTPQGFPFAKNQAFPALAARVLNLSGENSIELVNISNSAMTSFYVRDTAPRLLEYAPDALVIYVGHNEYYGNLTVADGALSFQILLNLQLKESRIFQLLFNLLTPPPQGATTLMERQYAQKIFPTSRKGEDYLIQTYIDNLESAIKPYVEKNIPVIIMSPVSNEMDLPPFNGSDAEEVFKKAATLEELTLAKDLDHIPFRARSNLINALKASFKGRAGVNILSTLSSLPEEPKTFSNQYFIDHVHFNWSGQVIVAKELTMELNRVLNLKDPLDLSPLNSPFSAKSLVFLTPFAEIKAYSPLKILFSRPPYGPNGPGYSNDLNKLLLEENFLLKIPTLRSLYEKVSVQEFNMDVMNYWIREKDWSAIETELRSRVWESPSSPTAYMDLAKFILAFPGREKEAEDIINEGFRWSGQDFSYKQDFLDYSQQLGK